jgi:hypothetical protein
MGHYTEKLLAGFASLLLLSACQVLAQGVLQDRAPDAPAVQPEETERDDAPQASPAPVEQPQDIVADESPRESGTVIAVAEDGTALVRTASGASVFLPPGEWEVGDLVDCVTRAGTTVCGGE